MTNRTLRVLIADDHTAFRASVRSLLSASDSIEIVAEAASGEEAVRLAIECRPDVAILDMRMPEADGIEATGRILDSSPATAVVILSLSYERQYVIGALTAGAKGYVAKEDTIPWLFAAMDRALQNQQALSPKVTTELEVSLGDVFTPEAERELGALFEWENAALFRCALAVSSAEEVASAALRQSALAYLIARQNSESMGNARVWFLRSIVSGIFERGSLPAAPEPEGRTGAFTRLRSLLRGALPSHGTWEDFAKYWRGRMSREARRHLLDHVRSCRSCHLGWSLNGFARLMRQDGQETPASSASIQRMRTALMEEIRGADAGALAAAFAQREIGARELLASEIEVFFGLAAAAEYRRTRNAPAGLAREPLLWASEFLGQGAAPFLGIDPLHSVSGG